MAISSVSSSAAAIPTLCGVNLTSKLVCWQPRQFPSSGLPKNRLIYSTRSRRRPPHLVAAKKQTFSSFDDMLQNSDKPAVLVDFYATWCGPCQLMVSILDQVSDRLKDRIQVVKIDTEKYPSIANQYKIEALPTFIVFKDGKPCDRFEGALTADQLVERIENSLKVSQ